MGALYQRPYTQDDNQESGNHDDVRILGVFVHEPGVHIIDEVGSWRKQVIVRGGDDFGKHGTHQQCANQRREGMPGSVGNDLAG